MEISRVSYFTLTYIGLVSRPARYGSRVATASSQSRSQPRTAHPLLLHRRSHSPLLLPSLSPPPRFSLQNFRLAHHRNPLSLPTETPLPFEVKAGIFMGWICGERRRWRRCLGAGGQVEPLHRPARAGGRWSTRDTRAGAVCSPSLPLLLHPTTTPRPSEAGACR